MEIAYDPHKNRINIESRGLPFDDVVLLDWTGALIWIDDRRDYGETRMNALVLMDDKLYAVTFTWRDSVAWIISFRRANNRERKKYDVQKT